MPTELIFPYPPSINHYYGFKGHRRFITSAGKLFREQVILEVMKQKMRKNMRHRLKLCILLHPPDKRKRDLDNILKPLLDALQCAHVFEDDSQIDELVIQRVGICKGGKCHVGIEEYVDLDLMEKENS